MLLLAFLHTFLCQQEDSISNPAFCTTCSFWHSLVDPHAASLLKGDGFFDQITCSVGLDGFFIFPDDDSAFISCSGLA